MRSLRDTDYAAFVAGGLCLFSLHIHSRDWHLLYAVSGFLLTAFGMARCILIQPGSVPLLMGFARISAKTVIFVLAGALLGIIAGADYRHYQAVSVFPTQIFVFSLVACSIGATEELVYRGFIQGALHPSGATGAVILTSLLHTLYKCSLFMQPQLPDRVDLQFLATATFMGGLVAGGLRALSGSVLAPIMAHLFYDLIVYGDYPSAPWWVWR
jgi:membrane protease YdiL (CAAX protease family)